MTGNVEIIASLVLLVLELIIGDVVNNRDTVASLDINLKDSCINLCENTLIGFSNSTYAKSCCQRGCRFFNLVDLHYKDYLNGTRNACEASCTEAYVNPNDRCVCNIGCNFMAKQRVSDLLPLFTIATCVEESIDILSMPPDIPESDTLTDPGLRKELLPRWWDTDGFKLPHTHIKTIPIDARTVDYTLASDYSGEAKQLASTSKYKSFQWKTKRPKNIPITDYLHFVYEFLLICFFLIAIGIYIIVLYRIKKISYKNKSYKNKSYKNKSYKNKSYKNNSYENNCSKDIMLFVPNEVVMYTISPPKHHNESFSHSI